MKHSYHRRKLNFANLYRSKIKKLGYSEKQIYQILLNYKHQNTLNHAKKHRRNRISKRSKDYAIDDLVNHKYGKLDLSVTAIAKKHHVSRNTLYRWYRVWKSNPHRANKTPLFTNHIPKNNPH